MTSPKRAAPAIDSAKNSFFFFSKCSFQTFFFFSSRRRHTRYWRDWSSDVYSSDLPASAGEAGGLGVDRRFLDPLALRLGPALLADQRDEGHGAEILLLEAVLPGAANAHQRLIAEFSDGDDQPAADGKLLLQSFGDMRTAGRDDDPLEGRFFRQALGAVGDNDLGIAIAEPIQPAAGKHGQHLVTLDGAHPVGHAAHHR